MSTGTGGGLPAPAPANTLESLLAKKVQLDEDLRSLERAVYDGEEAYLEETNHYGNCVRGWDGFLTSRPRPIGPTVHHASKRTGISVKERVFSLSSSTAPIEGADLGDGGIMDDIDALTGMGGAAAPLHFRGESGSTKADRRSGRQAKTEDGDQSD